MLKSLFRKASIAALLGVVACGAQPPAPAAAPASSPAVAQGAEAKDSAEGVAGVAGDAPGDSGALGAPAARAGVQGGSGNAIAGSADLGPVPVTAADPSWGSAAAPVTLVEFSDFQCPFCDRLNSTLEQLRKTYGPSKLRIVWKNNPLPFHNHARPAAEVAMALYEKGGASWFWQFHNAVFNKRLTGLEVIEDAYQFTGLSPQQVSALVARGTASRKVDDDMALGRQIGVNGTPASFINGVFLSGAQPFDAFSKVIDEQLVAASALLAQGSRPIASTRASAPRTSRRRPRRPRRARLRPRTNRSGACRWAPRRCAATPPRP